MLTETKNAKSDTKMKERLDAGMETSAWAATFVDLLHMLHLPRPRHRDEGRISEGLVRSAGSERERTDKHQDAGIPVGLPPSFRTCRDEGKLLPG